MKKRFEEIKNVMVISLFFGALWGTSEALLGYLLHFIPIPVSGFIMFPIAYLFMVKAYQRTQDKASILCVGIVAALIKLADLMLPFMTIDRILIPAALILIEASMVFIAFMLFKSTKNTLGSGGAIMASVGWRLVFLALQFIVYGYSSYFFRNGAALLVNFLLVEGLLNAVIIAGAAKLGRTIAPEAMKMQRHISPALSGSALVISVAATLVFASL